MQYIAIKNKSDHKKISVDLVLLCFGGKKRQVLAKNTKSPKFAI